MPSVTPSHVYKWQTQPKRPKEQPDWAFSLRWALATCLGGTLSWILAYALTFFSVVRRYGSVEQARETMLFGINALAIVLCLALAVCLSFGLFIGSAQALVLRKRPCWTGSMSAGWVVSNAIGYVVAFLLPFSIQGVLIRDLNLCSSFMALGFAALLLSGAQWFTLRSYVGRSDIWMFANSAGIMLAWGSAGLLTLVLAKSGLITTFFFDWGYVLASILVISVGFLVYGLITGVALNKMERDTTRLQVVHHHTPRRRHPGSIRRHLTP